VWRRDARSLVELGAYRSVERNLVRGDARAEPITIAEITPSAFRLVHVPPLVGRPLLDADAQPGATSVVVLGYDVWRQQFGGRTDVIGSTVQLGRTTTTIVGVMPAGFAFPINHRFWVPLPLQPAGYAPLDGSAVRVFARLAPGATQAEANAELTTLAQRLASDSPQTHERLRPRVLAYGGESPGDDTVFEFVIRHLPTLLVLTGMPLVTTVATAQPSGPVVLSSAPEVPLPSTDPVSPPRFIWKPTLMPWIGEFNASVRHTTTSVVVLPGIGDGNATSEAGATPGYRSWTASVTRRGSPVTRSMPSPCAHIATIWPSVSIV
jgi:hypothetical protein